VAALTTGQLAALSTAQQAMLAGRSTEISPEATTTTVNAATLSTTATVSTVSSTSSTVGVAAKKIEVNLTMPPVRATQLTSLGVVSVADPASPRVSAVLSVTIMDSAGGSASAGNSVVFEQVANNLTIKSVASPSTVTKEATAIPEKLTEFLVASSTGEMITFQGAFVNKRLVIVARTDAAKSMARAEANMVMAAAVTALSGEEELMLTQLEGVVLDLR
jgi:hypothetical protein